MGKANTGRKRTVLWAATGVQVVSGILYSWSIVSKALMKEYHWSSTEASLPYTIATIVFAISMFFTGMIQDKKGPRMMATIGSAMLGAGLFLCAFARTPLMMVLTFSVIVGAGVGINNVSATPAAVKWYPPEKKGMITGIVVAGIGIASVIYSPVVNALTASAGLSKTFMILGVADLLLAVGMSQLIVNPPDGYLPGGEAKRAQAAAPSGPEMDWRGMARTPEFYKLWLMFAFSASAGLMIIGHIAKIAQTQANWDGGYLLVALLAAFNALGRFLGGAISDKIGRASLMRIVFAVQAINMALFGLYGSVPLLALGVVVAGFCYGGTFSVFPAATADAYGLKNFGANYGLVFTAWGAGGVLGPLAAGAIFDATKSYQNAYLVALGLLAAAFAISFTLRKKRA